MVGFYNEVNLYLLKECQFLACRSIKLPKELIFPVTDGSVYARRMARLRSEILGLGYQGDAGQVFYVICFRRYQRTAYDFQSSVLKIGPIMLKSSEYDSLRLKINSFVTCVHIFRINFSFLKSRYLLKCYRKM